MWVAAGQARAQTCPTSGSRSSIGPACACTSCKRSGGRSRSTRFSAWSGDGVRRFERRHLTHVDLAALLQRRSKAECAVGLAIVVVVEPHDGDAFGVRLGLLPLNLERLRLAHVK